MSEFAIPTRAEVEAARIARHVAGIIVSLNALRDMVLSIDNASTGSYKARVGLADAADALEHTLEGLAEGFGAEP